MKLRTVIKLPTYSCEVVLLVVDSVSVEADKLYKKYNEEYYYDTLQNIYRQKGSSLLENGFPYIWDLKFLKIHIKKVILR